LNKPKKVSDYKSYYALWLKFKGRDQYLLWFSNEKDGIWVNDKGMVPVWENTEELKSFTIKVGIELEDEKPKCHDLDKVKAFLIKESWEIMANEVLEAWNLFIDLGNSVKDKGFITKDKGSLELYNEIFRLSGLLVTVKPSTLAVLDANYKTKLREILLMGFDLFEKYLL